MGLIPSPKDIRAAFRGGGLALKTARHGRKVGRRMRFRAFRRLLWKGLDVPRRDQYFAARTRLLAARQARRTRKMLQAEITALKQQKPSRMKQFLTLGGTGLVGVGGGTYIERERDR